MLVVSSVWSGSSGRSSSVMSSQTKGSQRSLSEPSLQVREKLKEKVGGVVHAAVSRAENDTTRDGDGGDARHATDGLL